MHVHPVHVVSCIVFKRLLYRLPSLTIPRRLAWVNCDYYYFRPINIYIWETIEDGHTATIPIGLSVGYDPEWLWTAVINHIGHARFPWFADVNEDIEPYNQRQEDSPMYIYIYVDFSYKNIMHKCRPVFTWRCYRRLSLGDYPVII